MKIDKPGTTNAALGRRFIPRIVQKFQNTCVGEIGILTRDKMYLEVPL